MPRSARRSSAHPRSGGAAERAGHWLAAGDAERALPSTIEAAAQAERQHAPAEAQQFWERALDLWETLDGPGDIAGVDQVELLDHAAEAANRARRPRPRARPGRPRHRAGRRDREPERAGAPSSTSRVVPEPVRVATTTPSPRTRRPSRWSPAISLRRNGPVPWRRRAGCWPGEATRSRRGALLRRSPGRGDRRRGHRRGGLRPTRARAGAGDRRRTAMRRSRNSCRPRRSRAGTGEVVELAWACLDLEKVAGTAGRRAGSGRCRLGDRPGGSSVPGSGGPSAACSSASPREASSSSAVGTRPTG